MIGGANMKYKTLNNMIKATRMIASKGYDLETANDLAIKTFENVKANIKVKNKNKFCRFILYIRLVISRQNYKKMTEIINIW